MKFSQHHKIRRGFVAVTLLCLFINLGRTNRAYAQEITTPAEKAAGIVSVAGNQILKDGSSWTPHGVVLIAFVAPPSAQKGVFVGAYQHYTSSEMTAIKDWGADTVRLQVSQPGIDPKSALYTPAFTRQVEDAVVAARKSGLNVIVSIQDEHQSGEGSPVKLPNQATGRVWRVLAPLFKDDRGVMYELLNEPQLESSPENWRAWATSMNEMIATVRRTGANNVVIADGLQFAQHLDGAPGLSDPLGQVVYAVHPYAHNAKGQSESFWDERFGKFAESRPVMVTEWTSTVPFYCDTQTPASALNLLRYLNQKHIGIVMFGYDFIAAKKFGSIVQDFQGTPTSFVGKQCGDEGYGPGTIVQQWYRTNTIPLEIR